MRTLERFFHRRKIKNADMWLENMGITTHAQLVGWCKNNDIFEPADIYFTVPSAEVPKKKAAKSGTSESDATWHTPAAERPRKSSKVKTPKTKRQVKK